MTWPYYIYDNLDEVASLQDFDHELSNRKKNQYQNLRIMCLFFLATQYITAWTYFEVKYFFVPFTNWTLMVTTASVLCSYWAATDDKHYKEPLWSNKTPDEIYNTFAIQARHNLLYTVAILFNFITMTVYWSVIHTKEVAKYKDMPDVGAGRVFHLYTVHMIPGMVCFCNTVITNTILS